MTATLIVSWLMTLKRRPGLAHRTTVDAGKAAYSKSHLKLLADI
jgi:hypothetical protein